MRGSRIGRTVVLGAVAAALGIWWLGRAYEVESSRLLGFLAASLVFIAVLIALGLGGAALLRMLRRRRPLGISKARPSATDAASAPTRLH